MDKKGSETKVTVLCKVHFSISKHYLDKLVCDVIEMDACHILHGSLGNSTTRCFTMVRKILTPSIGKEKNNLFYLVKTPLEHISMNPDQSSLRPTQNLFHSPQTLFSSQLRALNKLNILTTCLSS